MILPQLASSIPDTDIDWTSVILGFFAMAGSIFAAWAGIRTNRRIRIPNGKTIGEMVDALGKALEATRFLQEHEVGELEDIERARVRVSNEIANLTRLLDKTYNKVEGDKDDREREN
jgi:hypothetical protein